MKIYLCICCCLVLSLTVLNGQDQKVYENEHSESEFDVAINPLDSNNIIIASVVIRDDITSLLTLYYTRDFGTSWEKSDFIGLYDGYALAGDPVVAFDKNGHAVLVHLVASTDGTGITCLLSQSKDGGETWELKNNYGDFVDKPWFEIDNSDESANTGNIYMPIVGFNGVDLVSYNSDFELLNILNIPDGEQIPSIVTNNKGDIIMSNIDLRSNMGLYSHHISSGGENIINSNTITNIPDYTFNAPDVSTRYQPTPYLAIDNSDGPYAGRIYFAYTGSETINQDFFNIYLSYSDNQGANWSTPKIVHSDDRAGIQQFYSSIYVNDEGVLLIDWYDRTNFQPGSLMTDFFIGISHDGGESFFETRLNSEPMDFNSVIPAGGGFGIGEYHQLVATDHTALAFWSDGRSNNNILNIYFSKVDIRNPISTVEEHGLINPDIAIKPPFPSPAKDRINLDLEVQKTFKLKYQIMGLNGQLLSNGPSKKYGPGKHQINVDLNLAPGVYFLNLQSDQGYFNNWKFIVD